MNNWKNPHINLGKIKEHEKQKMTFYAFDTIPEIKDIIPSCGCTTPSYNKKQKMLNVSYNPGSLPLHLKYSKGYAYTSKMIEIHYIDGSMDTLSFDATIIKK